MRLHGSQQTAEARGRLQEAAAAAKVAPHRQLGHQTRQALLQLRAAKHVPQATAACATLSMCTSYSKACCTLLAGESAASSKRSVAPSQDTSLILNAQLRMHGASCLLCITAAC